MLIKNKSIVLSKVKYRDNDLIIRCYTLERGTVSYLARGILKNKSAAAKTVYFQPLSQLEIEESYKPNQSLQYFKEVKLTYLYNTLHSNIYKGSIVMFLSEILSMVLKEEEPNEKLFAFLEASFQYLDDEESYSNFHLLFLLKLTKFLGIQPETSGIDKAYFNLQTGTFQTKDDGSFSVSGEKLIFLKQLLGTNFDALSSLKLNSKQRQDLLDIILYYFELHLGSFKKPKSLKVFNEVFR